MRLSEKNIGNKLSTFDKEEQFEYLKGLVSSSFYDINRIMGFIQSMLIIAEELKDSNKLVIAKFLLAECYRQNEKIIKCRKTYQNAAEISKNAGYKIHFARALRGIGESYYVQYNYIEAEDYFRKSLDYTLKEALIPEKVLAYMCIGNCLRERFLEEEATNYFILGINIAIKHKSLQKELGTLYWSIAAIIKDSETKINYLNKSVVIFEKFQNPNVLISLNTMLSNCYKDLQNYTEAIIHSKKAIKYVEITKSPSHYFIVYAQHIEDLISKISVGNVIDYKLIESAANYHQKLIPYAQKSDKIESKRKVELLGAIINFYKKEYEQVLKTLLNINQKLKAEKHLKEIKQTANKYLYKTYENLSDYKSAFYYYQIYVEGENRMANEKSKKFAEDLIAKYGSKQKEEVLRNYTENYLL